MNTSIYNLQDRLTSAVAKPAGKNFLRSDHAKKGVMIVEDDEGLRKMLESILALNGYDVYQADCERQANQVWQKNFPKIDLLLTDVCIPYQTTGIALAKTFLAQKPWLKVIYMSGFDSEIAGPDELALVEGQNFLHKPCSAEDLLLTIKKAFPDQPQLAHNSHRDW